MKKYLLLLSFLCFINIPNTEAQAYQSLFGTDSTKWVFRWTNMNIVGNEYYYNQIDTLVNDNFYKKIGLRYLPESPGYKVLLREDTLSGKVWIRPLEPIFNQAIDTIEYLAFDFSLEVGDTFDVRHLIDDNTPIYSTVDSIKYINDLKYIYFDHLIHYAGDPGPWEFPSVPTEPFTLIEGIGSNAGPLWKNNYGEMLNQYLMCSYKDGEQSSYTNMRYAGLCPDPGTGIRQHELQAEAEINLYPNPASEYIIIKEAHAGILQSAGIYDLSGRKLREINKPGRMDISRMPAGLYWVKITTNKPLNYTKKLIVYH